MAYRRWLLVLRQLRSSTTYMCLPSEPCEADISSFECLQAHSPRRTVYFRQHDRLCYHSGHEHLLRLSSCERRGHVFSGMLITTAQQT